MAWYSSISTGRALDNVKDMRAPEVVGDTLVRRSRSAAVIPLASRVSSRDPRSCRGPLSQNRTCGPHIRLLGMSVSDGRADARAALARSSL